MKMKDQTEAMRKKKHYLESHGLAQINVNCDKRLRDHYNSRSTELGVALNQLIEMSVAKVFAQGVNTKALPSLIVSTPENRDGERPGLPLTTQVSWYTTPETADMIQFLKIKFNASRNQLVLSALIKQFPPPAEFFEKTGIQMGSEPRLRV
jgi:hypothetical protein